MNTITYYDIINDTTATLELEYEPLRKMAKKILYSIIIPLHYNAYKFEIANTSIMVFKDEYNEAENIIIKYNFSDERFRALLIGLDNEYRCWMEKEKEKALYCKIAIEYSQYNELDEDEIEENDFLDTIEVTDCFFQPFENLDELSDYLFNEANYKKGYIYFGDLSNISFRTIWYKKFHGKKRQKYCIHMIKRINNLNETVDILYSDGICTNGITHISCETKKWFDYCKVKIENIEQEANEYFNDLFAY